MAAFQACVDSDALPAGRRPAHWFFWGPLRASRCASKRLPDSCRVEKEAFIATGVVIAAMVDITRLMVYAERFFAADLVCSGPLLGAAGFAAFAGAVAGSHC